MPPIIEITNLSKQYHIGKREPYKTLRDTIVNTVTSPLRWFKRNEADEDNTIWALKDVSVEVNEGEVILNAVENKRLVDTSLNEPPQIVLQKLGFMKDDKLTNGAIPLFGKKPHQSFLRNTLIAKACYLAGYIEQYGSGTVRMTEWMKDGGLPEPEFKEALAGFSVYFYRDIYTEENLIKLGLNGRQIKAVIYIKGKGKITNKEYQELVDATKKTASRDMIDLVAKEIVDQIGTTGRGTYYTLRGQRGHEGDIKGT